MIHKACMPVYMNSGKIVADGTGGRVDGDSKVLQEVLAELKTILKREISLFLQGKGHKRTGKACVKNLKSWSMM